MSFLLKCPNCGPRSAYEYRFGGEYNARPTGPVSDADWASYVYDRQNVEGEQVEWWFHRLGCREWFKARRNTFTNEVFETYRAEDEAERGEPATVTEAETGGARTQPESTTN